MPFTGDYPGEWTDYGIPGDVFACAEDGTMLHGVFQMIRGMSIQPIVQQAELMGHTVERFALKPAGRTAFPPRGFPLWGGVTELAHTIAAIDVFLRTQAHFHYHDYEIIPGVTPLRHAISRLNAVA
jgi:hypothetical protein